MIGFLGAVLPWPFFLLGIYFHHSEVGAGTGALVMACWMTYQRRQPKWTDLTLLIYFFLLSHVLIPGRFLLPLEPVLAPALLTMMALLSLLIGCPFTEQFAREQVDASLWQDPTFPAHFYRVNRFLTLAWALAFFLMFLVGYSIHNWISHLVTLTIFLVVVWLTWFYPHWYHEKVYRRGNGPRPKEKF